MATLKLAAVAACHTAFAQPAFDPVAYDEQQRQIVEQIESVQTRDGVNSAGLIAPLTELALLYEESGNPVLAIAAIERALRAIRINRGIHSLEQAPLLQQAIRNEEAIDALAAAWDREQQLLHLAMRHPEDLRTVPIFRKIADKRMNLFDEWSAGEYPQQMTLAGYCEQLGQIFTCDRNLASRQILGDAQAYYADAIQVMLRNELYSSDELRALEMELVRTSDLPRARPQLVAETRLLQRSAVPVRAGSRLPVRTRGIEEHKRDQIAIALGRNPITTRLVRLSPGAPDEQDALGELPAESVGDQTYYEFGRHSLGRLYHYEVASSAPALDQLTAAVQLADWDLMYSRNALALERYEQVYAWLEETRAARPWIEELFSPTLPVVLPAFEPSPLASEESESSNGHIDVAFRITRYGEARRISVLDTTTNASDTKQKRLVQLIRGSRFRPRVTNDEFGVSRVTVRYYLNDSQDMRDDAAPSDPE